MKLGEKYKQKKVDMKYEQELKQKQIEDEIIDQQNKRHRPKQAVEAVENRLMMVGKYYDYHKS